MRTHANNQRQRRRASGVGRQRDTLQEECKTIKSDGQLW